MKRAATVVSTILLIAVGIVGVVISVFDLAGIDFSPWR
jgi:hypothetical protein